MWSRMMPLDSLIYHTPCEMKKNSPNQLCQALQKDADMLVRASRCFQMAWKMLTVSIETSVLEELSLASLHK